MKRKNENETEVPLKKSKQLSDISNLVASLIERLKEEQNVISGIVTINFFNIMNQILHSFNF